MPWLQWRHESREGVIRRLDDSSLVHRPPWFVGFPPWVDSRRVVRDETTRWDDGMVRSVVPLRLCGSSATCLSHPSLCAASSSFLAPLSKARCCALTTVLRPRKPLSSAAMRNRRVSFFRMCALFLQCDGQHRGYLVGVLGGDGDDESLGALMELQFAIP